MTSHILALDQGTTSSRAMVISAEGRIVSIAQKELTQHFPRPGWVEHDPEEIWKSQISVARQALRKAKLTFKRLAGIGISNQRETTLIWNRHTGEPIHRAIVWQDRRTAEVCDRLRKRKLAPEFPKRTGLMIDAYFSGTKIAWMLDRVEGARDQARRGELAFGTVDSWLLWKLTGGTVDQGAVHKTDITNASRSLLFNLSTGDWDRELARALKVPMRILPEVCSSSEIYGETEPTLFGGRIPVAGMAGDQHAALLGQMCLRSGMVKNTYGTGCFMLMNTGRTRRRSKNNLLSTTSWQIGDRPHYALEGSIFVAGAVIQWLRDGLRLIKRSSDVEQLAATVEDNGGVYMVPAFVGLGAPHWDAYARGTIVGLTRGTSAGHFARAALESIAYQTADVLDAMQADARTNIESLRVDGGAAMNDGLMQFQADVLQVPVVRPKLFESSALGAGYLAGLATGVWSDPGELESQWEIDKIFEPEIPASAARALRDGWNAAVERSKAWAQ